MLLHRLKEQLKYIPTTGEFIRLVTRPRAPKGSVAGTINGRGYRWIRVLNKRYQAHRLAWLFYYGEWPENEIDHINNDKDDNRITNLRDVTHGENQQNRIDAKWKWRQLKLPLVY